MDKLISIIVPCFNVERYIDRCFRSLRDQTIGIHNLELIFVDDASTDNTWDRLTEIEASCPESVLIIHCDENGRQGRARNIGLQYASAPYVGYVDSDDWVEADMYETLYARMREYSCDIVQCRNWRDTDQPGRILAPKKSGEPDQVLRIDTEEKRRVFLVCAPMSYAVWDKLFARDFLVRNQIFFPEGMAYEDHFFSTLLYLYAERVCLLEERLYHYYVNPESTVLRMDAPYYADMLTVDKRMWAECERRGFLDTYCKEMEYQFLVLCYLPSLKMMSLRMTKVPYDFFLELKEETLKRVPDYHGNPYIENLSEKYRILLQLLDLPVKEEEVNAVCRAYRALAQTE